MAKTFHHPNVMGFLGFIEKEDSFRMVSVFCANGNLIQYIEAHPDVDCLKLVGRIRRV